MLLSGGRPKARPAHEFRSVLFALIFEMRGLAQPVPYTGGAPGGPPALGFNKSAACGVPTFCYAAWALCMAHLFVPTIWTLAT